MFGIGMPELIIILIICLIIFGAGKLPEIGRSLGKTIKEFKKAGKEISLDKDISDEIPSAEEGKEEKRNS
ncbi:twin-arginine translocase TatA/TatE family subunit [Candidatus Auribacterota bacterium]